MSTLIPVCMRLDRRPFADGVLQFLDLVAQVVGRADRASRAIGADAQCHPGHPGGLRAEGAQSLDTGHGVGAGTLLVQQGHQFRPAVREHENDLLDRACDRVSIGLRPTVRPQRRRRSAAQASLDISAEARKYSRFLRRTEPPPPWDSKLASSVKAVIKARPRRSRRHGRASPPTAERGRTRARSPGCAW